MNVYLVNSGYSGCSYVRIMLPAFHNGFGANRASLLDKIDTPEEMYPKLKDADVVVFHRPEEEAYQNLARLLKNDGKIVVVDNDDTFKLDDVHPLAQFTSDAMEVNLARRDSNMDKFLRMADLATTSTDFLAKEYKNLNDNVVVLPNCVDPMDWDEPLKSEGNIRIGMVGSVSYEYDYLHLRKELRELGEMDNVDLVLFGLGDEKHRKDNPNVTRAFQEEYDFWDSVNKEQIQWCPVQEYPEKLNEARLDFMLIPRKDNYFNRCKSNVKFLEAAMCETPVIAQSFDDGPYEFITPDMGVLIRDNSKWMDEISRLASDRKLCREMGRKAKEYTLNNFNIEDKYHLWYDAYKKAYENRDKK